MINWCFGTCPSYVLVDNRRTLDLWCQWMQESKKPNLSGAFTSAVSGLRPFSPRSASLVPRCAEAGELSLLVLRGIRLSWRGLTSNSRVLEHQLKNYLKTVLVKSRPYALWHLKPFVCVLHARAGWRRWGGARAGSQCFWVQKGICKWSSCRSSMK